MSRVAVQLGAAWVRVAVADPRPRLLAALPVHGSDPRDVLRAGLAALFDRPVDELVVVHPREVSPPVPGGMAAAVRAVSPAAAALGGLPDEPSGTVVVDVGHSGTEIAWVSRGRVVAASRVPVGGAVLDETTAELFDPSPQFPGVGSAARSGSRTRPAEVRAARETLSLQPAVRMGRSAAELPADALRRVLAPCLARVVGGVRAMCAPAGVGRSPSVLLIGGVARTPLLAELLDAAGFPDVRVADRPDSAAVVGALRLSPELLGPLPAARCLATATALPASSASVPSDGPAALWLPPVAPVRRRPLRALTTAVTAAVALSALHLVGTALPAPGAGPLAAAGELVQYGYAVGLPVGWAHTGGLPERRRSLLTPAGAPDGGNLISVERTPLGYDTGAEPQRAHAELRAEFARAVAGGAPLTGFDDTARFAGRSVVAYREAGDGPDGDAVGAGADGADTAQVDWYVVLDGDAQLSVGCRHTAAAAAVVAPACATVVGSVRRTT